MVQPLVPRARVGERRTGPNKGGIRQRYWLDEPGRQLLLARYDGRTETIDELSRRLSAPRWRVMRWATDLGLARPNPKEPRWTDADLAYLEGYLHRVSIAEIARHLGRTPTAVRVKAKRIGVNKSAEGLTMRKLCEALGCDHHKVERWLASGWLHGTRRQSDRTETQGGDMWLFTEKHLRAFIAEHPNEVDPRRADWVWLVDLLTGA